ncbi:uncharacterized protein LOC131299682 [Rhododendron vialii]|uniref:uncharacterized protein LOC131299682 n=1 Tax=Rhododendron vialii TaxID=182163 RepID=UPI00265D7343|nr:uncharacterized protein LOC131299682 [Rhododendron vialii]
MGKKRGREEVYNKGIVFTDEDLGGVQADLVQSITPLVGFGAGAVWPLGKVTLPIRAGIVVLHTDFLVVDVPSSYNAIIGRTWLHKMRAVSFTYHQMVKFPGSNGVEKISGNQKVIQQDSGLADHRGCRRGAAEKVVEGLKKIQINETDPKRYFLIGENLSKKEEQELVGFLREYIDVFAWVPEEMPGVDANKQRLYEKFCYPEWLSNTVVVKKKNGKWHVCVDFTDLNKGCPKDSFPLPRIDQLVDATAGYGWMSFLNAYWGYHQIAIYGPDQ